MGGVFVGVVSKSLREQRSLEISSAEEKQYEHTKTVGPKIGHILAIFIYGTSSGPLG